MLIAATEPAAAPWWGVPVIAGTFAILGVLATQWTAWILDRRRSRREDKGRWHAGRRASYASFVAAMDTLYMAVFAYLVEVEEASGRETAARSAALEKAKEANLNRQDLNLLASRAVRDAAQKLWLLPGAALASPAEIRASMQTTQTYKTAHEELLSKLLEIMRQELGTSA